ncbi:hypothetical protein VNO77_44867 [Canavalia gladiata]|uniref:Uncharacterized protein n=1 Tax=Canavalia gladiata TaxID=3824 RepID=A0AAN9PQP4_CANGL
MEPRPLHEAHIEFAIGIARIEVAKGVLTYKEQSNSGNFLSMKAIHIAIRDLIRCSKSMVHSTWLMATSTGVWLSTRDLGRL